jgi:hypothetical protein
MKKAASPKDFFAIDTPCSALSAARRASCKVVVGFPVVKAGCPSAIKIMSSTTTNSARYIVTNIFVGRMPSTAKILIAIGSVEKIKANQRMKLYLSRSRKLSLGEVLSSQYEQHR